MSTTSIEWVRNPDLKPGETWNPTAGCEPVSDGCKFCYPIPIARIRESNPHPAIAAAYEGLTTRGEDGRLAWSGRVNLLPDRLDMPVKKRKPTTYFIDSMSDVFHKSVPDEFVARIFAVMAVCPRHTFIIATKRHGRMRSLLSSAAFPEQVQQAIDAMYDDPDDQVIGDGWPLTNVRLGVSVENQATALLRIPALLDTPAAVRWISAEPLLGPVDLGPWLKRVQHACDRCDPGGPLDFESAHLWGNCTCGCHPAPPPTLDWIVTGGESGSDRPAHPDWFRSLRDQAVAAKVPFFFKQHGEFLSVPVVDAPGFDSGRAYQHPGGGMQAAIIREPGPSGTMRNAVTRPLRPGDRTKGGVMLDAGTFALKVGKKKAGHVLDGQVWQQFPGFGEW